MKIWSLIVVFASTALLTNGAAPADPQPLCGPECLYTSLVALGVDPGTYSSFLERIGGPDARGTSLGRLGEIAREFNLSTLEVETSLENLRARRGGQPFSCIAHVDGNHFVLVGDVDAKSVWSIDPPREGLVAAPVFQQRWKGHALLLSRTALTPEEDLSRAGGFRFGWLALIAAGAIVAGGLSYWTWRRRWSPTPRPGRAVR